MPEGGFEPPQDIIPHGPQPCASTSSATPARMDKKLYKKIEMSREKNFVFSLLKVNNLVIFSFDFYKSLD
jgi:hypothetical protein